METAFDYIGKMTDFIYQNIETYSSKPAPKELKILGERYIMYKSNKRTAWYIFFDYAEETYLVTNILNNHQKEIGYLNLWLPCFCHSKVLIE